MANLLISRLDDHVLGLCVRRLPLHQRPFAVTARAGKRLQRAVEAAREELGEQVCETVTSATDFCVLLLQLTGPPARKYTYADVDLRSSV